MSDGLSRSREDLYAELRAVTAERDTAIDNWNRLERENADMSKVIAMRQAEIYDLRVSHDLRALEIGRMAIQLRDLQVETAALKPSALTAEIDKLHRNMIVLCNQNAALLADEEKETAQLLADNARWEEISRKDVEIREELMKENERLEARVKALEGENEIMSESARWLAGAVEVDLAEKCRSLEATLALSVKMGGLLEARVAALQDALAVKP